MKRTFISLFGLGLVFALTACGSGDGDSMGMKAKVEELGNTKKIVHFTKGDFGEITLSESYVIPEDAVFIDIRNAWERKVNPKGSVRATYEIRTQGANGKENKSIARKMNDNFVSDVLNLPAIAHDRDKHIILICASGSRSGAHGDKVKASAAKLLSDNGFSYVEHVKHGMWAAKGWMENKLPYVEQ